MSHSAYIAHRFSRAAESYDDCADVQRITALHVASLAERYFPRESIILDGGCGTGALAQLLPHHRFIQCDYAEKMVQAAHLRNLHHGALVGDVTCLPVATEVMDGYVTSLCWQWARPLEKAIHEMYRVLKPSAYAVIATLTKGTFHELALCLRNLDLPQQGLTFLENGSIGKLLSAAGMRIVHSQEWTHQEYHADTNVFFKQLQGIGATATLKSRLLRRGELTELINQYDKTYGSSKGISATYVIGFWVVQK